MSLILSIVIVDQVVRKVFSLNHNTTGILPSQNDDAPYKWANGPVPIQPPPPKKKKKKKKKTRKIHNFNVPFEF